MSRDRFCRGGQRCHNRFGRREGSSWSHVHDGKPRDDCLAFDRPLEVSVPVGDDAQDDDSALGLCLICTGTLRLHGQEFGFQGSQRTRGGV